MKQAALKLLYIIIIPIVLGSISSHIFMGSIRRIKEVFIKTKPDTNLLSKKVESKVSSINSIPSILPVPNASMYIGDIFGYFKFLRTGGPNSIGKQSKMIGETVFSINVGRPVVACVDHLSAETLFANVDNLTQDHLINLVSSRQSKPIFTTYGPKAQKARRFILSQLPEDENAHKFQNAMKTVRSELDEWAEFSKTKIGQMSVENAASSLICKFASCLFLGLPLDQSLVDKVFPIPNYLPLYPTIPITLFPSYHNMQSSLNKMFDQLKQSDNWEQILSKSSEIGLSEREAFEQLFTAITFNAGGLSNSVLNGILLTSVLPDRGMKLLNDEEHLTSFVWELLRHNGPAVMMRLSEDTLIKTAEGKHHKLRSGTIVYCSTSMAQRDGSQWKDPTIFRSKRFIENVQNTMSSKSNEQIGEPLPTLGFGCPIHRSNRIEPVSNMHQCPFLPFAPSFLKDFLRLLIGNYKWSFDADVLEHVNVLKNDDGLEVDFDLKYLRCGIKASEDMVPIMSKGMHFSSFSKL